MQHHNAEKHQQSNPYTKSLQDGVMPFPLVAAANSRSVTTDEELGKAGTNAATENSKLWYIPHCI